MLNMEPIIRPRHFRPIRTFITKWDVEIENNRIKDKSRRRERFNKYYTELDTIYHTPEAPKLITFAMIDAVKKYTGTNPLKRNLNDDCDCDYDYDPVKRRRIFDL